MPDPAGLEHQSDLEPAPEVTQGPMPPVETSPVSNSEIAGSSLEGEGEQEAGAGGEASRRRPTARFDDGVLQLSGTLPEDGAPFDVDARWHRYATGTMRLTPKAEGGYSGGGTLALSVPGYAGLPFGLKTVVDGTAVTGGVALTAGNAALAARHLFEQADTFGWSPFDALRGGSLINTFGQGKLELGLNDFGFSLGTWVTGKANFALQIGGGVNMRFGAQADLTVPGLKEAKVELSLDEQKVLRGSVRIAASWAKFSGEVEIEVEDKKITGEGQVSYTDERLSGTIHLLLTDRAVANSLARAHILPGTGGEGAPQPAPPAPAEAPAAPATIDNPVLAGWGELDFSFTEWFTGKVKVIVDGKGDVTTVGEIAPPVEIELFPQRDWIKKLFSLEVRARYGVPLVGNIFVFANLSLEALAKLGPGKIYNIKVLGQFSTDSTISNALSLQASMNISAFAGLRLRAEGGAGLELLGHDIKVGVGINALAGVRGYVEATPTIGYREQGGEPQFYLAGVLDLAAQPFLGLSGDLFVELDSPWWSPAPDKKWTWPVANIDYPLPGEIAVRARVDHTLGSTTAPEIEFTDPGFDGNKFFTDLVNDHVPPPKGDASGEQEGEWHEEGEGGSGDGAGGAGSTPAGGAPNATGGGQGGGQRQGGGQPQTGSGTGGRARPGPGQEQTQQSEYDGQVGESVTWSDGSENHRMWIDVKGRTATPMVASNPQPIETALGKYKAAAREKGQFNALKTHFQTAGGLASSLKTKSNRLASASDAEEKAKLDDEVERLQKGLKGPLRKIQRGLGLLDDTEDKKKARRAFGDRLFSRSELEEALGITQGQASSRLSTWKGEGAIFPLASGSRDPRTEYSFDATKAGQRETSPNNRSKYGYINPRKTSAAGMKILSKRFASNTPKPKKTNDPAYHQGRARYRSVVDPGTYSSFRFPDAILGHKRTMGASDHWNLRGHKQSREANKLWNQNPRNYAGPEHKAESSKSGPKSARYRVPSKSIGSHKDWL